MKKCLNKILQGLFKKTKKEMVEGIMSRVKVASECFKKTAKMLTVLIIGFFGLANSFKIFKITKILLETQSLMNYNMIYEVLRFGWFIFCILIYFGELTNILRKTDKNI